MNTPRRKWLLRGVFNVLSPKLCRYTGTSEPIDQERKWLRVGHIKNGKNHLGGYVIQWNSLSQSGSVVGHHTIGGGGGGKM